jgi:hypothetical protein
MTHSEFIRKPIPKPIYLFYSPIKVMRIREDAVIVAAERKTVLFP